MSTEAEPLRIAIEGAESVSGLLMAPAESRVCVVLAHGAGAGMGHPFMAAFADGLAVRGIASLRYQFPYMERRSKRPDSPAVAKAAVRAAVAEAARRLPRHALIAAGKSFGGRMSSQAQAAEPLPAVLGLLFVGFPLHPAGEPGVERARHLADIALPMLFLQGTRDELAEAALIEQTVASLKPRATLHFIEDGDHSFHVRAKSGRNDAQVMAEMLDVTAAWIAAVVSPS